MAAGNRRDHPRPGGVGRSRGPSLRELRLRWYDWGLKDFDAVLVEALRLGAGRRLSVVGHSFGGFGVGLARNGRWVDRLLTVGAQHAYWRDYRRGHRLDFYWRWHVVMPLATLRAGYFPGKRRGWLEDLPAGVALDWARSRKDFTAACAMHRTAPRGWSNCIRRMSGRRNWATSPYSTAVSAEPSGRKRCAGFRMVKTPGGPDGGRCGRFPATDFPTGASFGLPAPLRRGPQDSKSGSPQDTLTARSMVGSRRMAR